VVSIIPKIPNAPPSSQRKGITMQPRVRELLTEIGSGKMSDAAYDTAWVARLGEIDWELSTRALAWLGQHQLSDGSWGNEYPLYYHDRVISTLAAMIALTYRGRRRQDRVRIERGLLALEKITDNVSLQLQSDPNGATVGFEMITPTLVAEAERLGLIKQRGDRILSELSRLRKIKMSKLEGRKIDRTISTAFSAEMAGSDHISLLDVDNLQGANGSVGNSPAATVHFSIFVRKGDPRGLHYLRSVVGENGGTPFAAPFDIFERSWILWNLALTGTDDKELLELFTPHLDYLYKHWDRQSGVGFSAVSTSKDGDDTSLTFDILRRFNYGVELETVLHYEEEEYFRCYDLEANSSITANVHVLGALKQAGAAPDHPAVQKIIKFLMANRRDGHYWLDKWHTSPFYPTAHIVIAAHDYDHSMCRDAVEWILERQRPSGGWGSFGVSTAEETAYCLQALNVWRTHGGAVSEDRIQRAASWLEEHSSPPYPYLWIGKVLYCPEHVVTSSILSALMLSRK